jgi:glycosyltransferase involved in cell wall biosynthesis
MFAGNIGAAQDFTTILAAADRLKSRSDIHWIIIGDGRQYDWVVAEVVRRGLRDTVHLLGRHPLESMPRYFALADVMLVTLKKEPIFGLTVPAKVQSYLACAKPIVAALEGEGARVLIESGAGIAVEPENAAMLAEAVLTLANTPAADRRAMGENGLAYFRAHFDRAKLVEELEGLMQKLTRE